MIETIKLNVYESNYKVVANTFTVMDIAEPIRVIISPNASKLEVWNELMLSEYNDWFAIVKDEEQIHGFYALDVNLEDNLEEIASSSTTPITPDLIVPYSTSLLEIIPMFLKRFFYFVLDKNQISHVITFSDLDKLPVKISMFSIILELESNLINLIWTSNVSIDDYLLTIKVERKDEIVRLCIQKFEKYSPRGALLSTNFIDKMKLIKNEEILKTKLGFSSNTELNKRFQRIQEVRNRIAHSGSILEYLETPVKLNNFINDIYEFNNKVVEVINEHYI